MDDGERLPINDITIDINDNEESIRSVRSGRSGYKPECPRLPVPAKLFWLWNLLFELTVGILYIGLMSVAGDDYGGFAVVIGGLLFVCAHTAVSAALFKRYYQKNRVPAWKFVLWNSLPLFIIGAVMILIPILSNFIENDLDLGFVLVSGVFGLCFACYSAVYGVFLTAVLGIGHLIERNREKSR